MQWKRNAGREQGGELNSSLSKRKKKKYGRLLSPRPAELSLLAEPARTRACFTAVKSHVTSIWKYHCMASERHLSVSQNQIFCWDIFAFYGLLEQLKSSPEFKTIWKEREKNESNVPAAFYPVSASKIFQRNWRCEKSSSHYWQWKPLRHFRCFIAFN